MTAGTRSVRNRHKSPDLPWSFRLFDKSPFGAAVTGFLLGFLMTVVLVLLELGSGRPHELIAGHSPATVGCEFLLGDYRIGIVGVILLAYATTARFVLSRWTYGTAKSLHRADFQDAETILDNHRWGIAPGIVGALITLLVAIDISERDIEWTREYWIVPHIFNWFWCLPFGWVTGRLVFALMSDAVLISRVARSIEVTDLSDTAPLEATVKHGSRSAFLSLILLGLVSVHFIDPGLNLIVVGFLIILFGIGTAISVLPAMDVVQVLYKHRDQQLALLDREIEIEREQLLANDPDYEPGRIGDIIALESRLKDWNVTAFRLSNIARLALYSFIGFLSWLGAAAVSVVVENFFGF